MVEKFTQQERNGLYELTDEARAELKGNPYYNEDLAPTRISERTWNTYNVTALWISICICIPSFAMAAGLVVLGLSPWLAVFNITLGNLLVLIPMQLNSRAGTQYGIPFPIFSRMTFGMRGAHIPSLARGLAACGWNAFQCWLGAWALVEIFAVFVPGVRESMLQARIVGFFVFLSLCMWATIYGAGALKKLKAFAGPILAILITGAFAWSLHLALTAGYTFGDVIQASSDPARIAANGGLLLIFAGGLTANIGFWGTMAINIPDFSRYANSLKAQFRGQLYAVPASMFACAFIGAFMAQSTRLVYGTAIFNPMLILSRLENPVLVIIVAAAAAFATLTTNIAANIVAPANGLTNLIPKKISYKMGVVITCLLAIAFQPWWLFTYAERLFNLFIGTYGGILAPLAAIFVADFYRIKQCRLNVVDLFKGEQGRYWYSNGFNNKAIIAWVAGFIFPTIGRVMAITAGGGIGSAHLIDNFFFRWVTANAYIFGFVVAYIVYTLIMDKGHVSFVSEEENKAITAKE